MSESKSVFQQSDNAKQAKPEPSKIDANVLIKKLEELSASLKEFAGQTGYNPFLAQARIGVLVRKLKETPVAPETLAQVADILNLKPADVAKI